MRRRSTRANLLLVSPSEEVYEDEFEANPVIPIEDAIPVYGERLSYFIAGPPGCGKSTTISEILSYFPDQPKYLFTDIEEKDRAFRGIDFRKVKMDPTILQSITLDKLTKDGTCWCVFDDVDKIRDPKKSKILLALMDNILANGRSHGKHAINIIVTSHSLADYKRTKYSIENCDYWVIFPSKTMDMQLKTLLKKDGIDKYLSSLKPLDRVFYHRSSPHFFVFPSMAALI